MKQRDNEQALFAELIGAESLDDVIPSIARNRQAIQRIEAAVRGLSTSHELVCQDAGIASALEENSIQLVVTSPPYWTLKRYREHHQQLGHVADYEEFHDRLDNVWRNWHSGTRWHRCFRFGNSRRRVGS